MGNSSQKSAVGRVILSWLEKGNGKYKTDMSGRAESLYLILWIPPPVLLFRLFSKASYISHISCMWHWSCWSKSKVPPLKKKKVYDVFSDLFNLRNVYVILKWKLLIDVRLWQNEVHITFILKYLCSKVSLLHTVWI